MNIQEKWEQARPNITEAVSSEVVYNTYLRDAVALSYKNNVLTLSVSLPTKKRMIELKYKTIIEKEMAKILCSPVLLNIIVGTEGIEAFADNNEAEEIKEEEKQSAPSGVYDDKTGLNPQYTFANFVVGASNNTAFATAENMVNFPQYANNMLFLYGKSGLGKTHLMQAIGNEILKKAPSSRILYVTSERFTIDLVEGIKNNRMEYVRSKYRDIDVLLLDHVQFLEGREGTQEEIFNTFDSLHNRGKSIVLTSDRTPKELLKLTDRLRTRFEWGAMIDISQPDYETRVAILKKKAENLNISIDNDVYDYVAQLVKSNVRELEGALLRVIAFAGVSGQHMDIKLAETALKSITSIKDTLTPQEIIDKVCDFYEVSVEDVKGPSRVNNLVIPRHVSMYLCKKLTDMNFPTIAKIFGNRDRTTVMHAVDKVFSTISTDEKLKEEIDFIMKDLES